MGSRLWRSWGITFLTLGLLFAQPCCAESKRNWKKLWVVTVVALAAANAADVHSSSGLWEANPLLRDQTGRLHARKAIVIKSAASGGFVLLEAILLKKMPGRGLYKPFALTNMTAAGVVSASAVRNYRIPRPPTPDYLAPR